MKTDLQLVQDVKGGEKKAFEELMMRHEKFLMKVVVRLTRDLDLAEDIVQEAFIKAYKRLSLFEGRASFRSWLYQIAINTARNRFRKYSRETLTSEPTEQAVASVAEQDLIALDVRAVLQAEIERLPDRQKTALTLRIFEDLSFKEIAELMACPYDTAKANYRHAILKLKERLESNVMLKTWQKHHPVHLSLIELGGHSMEVDGQ
jgi:RNA polymerase sigma-70 factor (ECF subfamily)